MPVSAPVTHLLCARSDEAVTVAPALDFTVLDLDRALHALADVDERTGEDPGSWTSSRETRRDRRALAADC